MQTIVIPSNQIWVTKNNYRLALYYKCSICGDLQLKKELGKPPNNPGCKYYLIIKNMEYDQLDFGVAVEAQKVQQTLF